MVTVAAAIALCRAIRRHTRFFLWLGLGRRCRCDQFRGGANSGELEAFAAWQEAQEPKVQQQEADEQDADKDKVPVDIREDDDS